MNLLNKLFTKKDEDNFNYIFAPVAGEAIALTEVPDAAFAAGELGNGIGIIPTDGHVYAPANGIIDMTFETGHAVSMIAENGAEVLIHVGIDTVKLNGRPFEKMVQTGQKVKKGDLMLIADLAAIKDAGLSTVTTVIVHNHANYASFNTFSGKTVTTDDVVIELKI